LLRAARRAVIDGGKKRFNRDSRGFIETMVALGYSDGVRLWPTGGFGS
jgi:hypothetical protein